MKAVNVHEARAHFSRLLDRAHAGEEIVIVKSGQPYARLMPLRERASRRRPGTLYGMLELTDAFFDSLPPDWTGGRKV